MPARGNMPRVCLITGASRGIGRETAKLLSENGYTVYASMRDPESRNKEHAASIGEWATVLELDVTDSQTVRGAVDEIERREGRIDVVVNNAGYVLYGPVEEMRVEDAQRQFETNFFGPLRIIGEVAPLMRRQGGGVIVQISSISGLIVTPMYGMYQASKHALEAMSEALAYEIGHFGVRVVIIEPGNYKTGIVLETTQPLKDSTSAYQELNEQFRRLWADGTFPLGDSAEVARAVLAAIEDPQTPLRVLVGKDAVEDAAVRRSKTDDEYREWLTGFFEW